ncbi:hypothetical protein AHF37_07349 [Paragonimus kellicotti]|nr:hypothetical protein AHF37_07349 [Paragonimus kellicotti]
MSHFQDYVCVVTGATRGIGRGIALGLGELGATVYITGRTDKPTDSKVGGSLEETAAEIKIRGGKAIPVVVDHADEKQVTSLFEQVRREQRGRLDVLVNNVYAAVPFLCANDVWDVVNNVGLRNHYICSTLATRIMLDYRKQTEGVNHPGLIVNVSSIGARRYLFNTAYGAGKAALDRMTADMSVELKRNGADVCVVSLWPGLVRTEELMSRANELSSGLRPHMDPAVSESPELSGRAVASLLAESPDKLMARSGQIVLVSDVAAAYGVREPDGTTPPNLRSVQLLMRLSNHTTLARFIPGFIRLPMSLFLYLTSSS